MNVMERQQKLNVQSVYTPIREKGLTTLGPALEMDAERMVVVVRGLYIMDLCALMVD